MMANVKAWAYLKMYNGEKAKVDQEDLARVQKHKWYVIQQRNSGKRQAVANIKTAKGFKQMTLGKFLMKPRKGKFVYPRRTGEILDYRKQNLIVCTMKERQIMLPKRKSNCSSQFKGVTWDKTRSSWRAHIDHKGQTRTIGYYSEEDQAALAYNKKAKSLYGDIAYQNQVARKKGRRKSDG